MYSKIFPLTVLLLGFLFLPSAHSQESTIQPLNQLIPAGNQLILNAIKTMPAGGGYSAGATATQALRHAVRLTENKTLQVDPSHAMPSYCSGATYLVFLKVITALQDTHRISLAPETFEALKPEGQPDGTGIWGRWNANGPGTARLFYELGLGHNFSDLAEAQCGDFLKIWWNEAIGSAEHGHSVVYMGSEYRNGIPYLSYWSSNVPGGFGVKSVPLSRIHRMLFSRLQYPQALTKALSLPRADHYLYSLQTHNSTAAEMNQRCGVR